MYETTDATRIGAKDVMIDDAKLLLERILIQQGRKPKPEEIADATPAPIRIS